MTFSKRCAPLTRVAPGAPVCARPSSQITLASTTPNRTVTHTRMTPPQTAVAAAGIHVYPTSPTPMSQGSSRPLLQLAGMPLVGHLVRLHWRPLVLALFAVVGETVADVLEPWPIKVVVDNILQGKKLPPSLQSVVAPFGDNTIATLNFAIAAVLTI